MEPATTAFALAALSIGLVILVVWLLLGRQRLTHEVGEASGERRHFESELARAIERGDQLEETLDETRTRLQQREVELAQLGEQFGAERRRHEASIETEAGVHAERIAGAEQLRQKLEERLADLNRRFEDTFKALAADALKTSSEEFLRLAKERFDKISQEGQAELSKRRSEVEALVRPIGDTLRQTREKLDQIEQTRAEAFARLHQQVADVTAASAELRSETGRLSRALSKPDVRGRYGEIQLRRVAELAGMVPYCDFTEQSQTRDDAGRALRPDMVVHLPNRRVVAIDAKTNTSAYMDALEADSAEQRDQSLDLFARHMSDQVTALGRKQYWAQYDGSPEFVVMFVPGDHFLDAALARTPDLLERAALQKVILASPATLIGLLRAVAVGWREHTLAADARELFELGSQLHERAAVALDHAGKLGQSLRQAVDRYNRFAASVDSRLMPTLRRFEESGAKSGREIDDLPEINVQARLFEAPETADASEADADE